MHVKLIEISKNWKDIKNSALTTVGKESNTEPSTEWKRKILFSEHSPIRKLKINAIWHELFYWVSVHLVRHKHGVEHWVRSQRTDRSATKTDRNQELQSALIEHEIDANAQAIINISRKRLCYMASIETREAWQEFINSFQHDEPELYSVCVKECVYRNGICPEFKSCGYNFTDTFVQEVKEYTKGFEKQINYY